MTRRFVHLPLFRIVSPAVSGIVVYLLILLINNNVAALEGQFLSRELYVCIALSYLIQEVCRLVVVVFGRFRLPSNELLRILIQLGISFSLSVILVSLGIYLYYLFVLGFEPVIQEYRMFNGIFAIITMTYMALYISHDYLRRIHDQRIAQELNTKENLEADFRQFRQGINVQLLFESLESLIVYMKVDKEKADVFLEHLSRVYRYILSRKNELVEIRQELEVLDELLWIFNSLPNRQVRLTKTVHSDFLVVPGVLLHLIEGMIRNSIATALLPLQINLGEDEQFLVLSSEKMERLGALPVQSMVRELSVTYGFYSDQWLQVEETEVDLTIKLPKLLPER